MGWTRRAGSALDHRDIHTPDLALGVDLHGLLVTGGAQGEVGRKSVGFDEHFDLATAGGALQIAEDVAAGFGPVAGDSAALARHVAAQVELVAVAGAMQALLQAQAGTVDLVIGLAADALGRAVGQRNRSGAGPVAVEPCKRPTGLGMTRRYRQHQRGADAGSLNRLSKQTEAEQFHIEFPISKMTFSL